METVRVPGRSYRFRSLQVTEVVCVNRMLRAEYGDSYPYPLSAERLSEERLRRLRRRTDEIVAFAKAEYRNPGFYEVGGSSSTRVTASPDSERRSSRSASRRAYRRGARMIFAEPVCYRSDHASQRLFLRLGFRHVAVELFQYRTSRRASSGISRDGHGGSTSSR